MIDSIGTGSSNTTQGLGVAVNAASDLKMDFLKLLTVQLANQDPLSPMDNEAMVQQLATFSQLEQLEGVNNKLDQQMQYSQSLSNTMMMDIVGKRVTVIGDGVQIEGGSPSRSLVRTIEPGIGYARIFDEQGNQVRKIDGIRIEPGFTEIEWDGKGDDGQPLPDGNYFMEMAAERSAGGVLSVAVFQSGIVDTVQFDDNRINLMINGRSYSPAHVVEVGVAPQATPSGGTTPRDEDDDDDGTPAEDPSDPVPPSGDPGGPDSPTPRPGRGGGEISLGTGISGQGPLWSVPWDALRGLG